MILEEEVEGSAGVQQLQAGGRASSPPLALALAQALALALGLDQLL